MWMRLFLLAIAVASVADGDNLPLPPIRGDGKMGKGGGKFGKGAIGKGKASQGTDTCRCGELCTIEGANRAGVCQADGKCGNATSPSCDTSECPMDYFSCPNGYFVERKPPSCEFEPCPKDNSTMEDGNTTETNATETSTEANATEPMEGNTTEGGFMDEHNTSEWGELPPECPHDYFPCPNGYFVTRKPPNCEFPPCPKAEQNATGEDEHNASDTTEDPFMDERNVTESEGSSTDQSASGLEMRPVKAELSSSSMERKDTTMCTMDAKTCPDGSSVGRIPPKCEFAPCPGETTICPMDAKTCPDGSSVGRIPPKCEFAPCPGKCICGQACRNPKNLKPGFCHANGKCLGKKKAPMCGKN